jgi:DNA-directed RNA polymerase subunit M/transcription elongation factor TFIIS
MTLRSKQTIMVVMVTCKNCGHKYQSNVLQTPDEETLRSEPREDIMENCPKCNQISSYDGPDFYWE